MLERLFTSWQGMALGIVILIAATGLIMHEAHTLDAQPKSECEPVCGVRSGLSVAMPDGRRLCSCHDGQSAWLDPPKPAAEPTMVAVAGE